VQTIWPGSAAAASQIACFDELVTLDGLSLNPQSGRSLSEQELRERMAGALGSSLTLLLRKPAEGSRVYVVNLVRSNLEMKKTFNLLFPAVSTRRITGPVALRLVLDGDQTER
jgi:C-terminal processing protease CtpA/Prc